MSRKIINSPTDFKNIIGEFLGSTDWKLITQKEINDSNGVESETNSEINSTLDAKLKILENELKIIEESNSKLIEENETLKGNINNLNNEVKKIEDEIQIRDKIINQFNIDKDELSFLRLNLDYGHKCRRTFFNTQGFIVGTAEYKKCVLNKGRLNE